MRRQTPPQQRAGLVQRGRIAAIVAVADPGIEQRIARKNRRLRAVREQAHMRHRVTGRVQAFQFDGLADADHIAGGQAAIDAADQCGAGAVRQHRGTGGLDQRGVAPGVIVMLMGVDDLRNGASASPVSPQPIR